MPTTLVLGAAIKAEADAELKYWVDNDCSEVVENGGPCVLRIHQEFGNPAFVAWCAQFGWMCVNRATAKLGITNKLPQLAGAANMLAASKKVLPVSKTPAVGALMYRKSSEGTGHIGVVVEVDAKGFHTIEGNAGDKVAYVYYTTKKIKSQGMSFIHAEMMSFLDRRSPGWT